MRWKFGFVLDFQRLETSDCGTMHISREEGYAGMFDTSEPLELFDEPVALLL